MLCVRLSSKIFLLPAGERRKWETFQADALSFAGGRRAIVTGVAAAGAAGEVSLSFFNQRQAEEAW